MTIGLVILFGLVFLTVLFFILRIDYINTPFKLTDHHEKECKWNGGEKCPYVVELHEKPNPRIRLGEGSLGCCKMRQTHIKIAKGIVDGTIPSSGSKIIDDCISSLDRHKSNYPEEHEYLFGKDEHSD